MPWVRTLPARPGHLQTAHSMGGSVAIMLASRRPDLVSRLVVAEANLDPGWVRSAQASSRKRRTPTLLARSKPSSHRRSPCIEAPDR